MLDRTEIVCLNKEEFAELVKRQERIEAVKRLLNSSSYVCIEDICALLEIENGKRCDDGGCI